MMESQIRQVESRINPIVDEFNSPILTIPGISYRMAAILIAETKTSTISIQRKRYLLTLDWNLLFISRGK